MKPLEFALLADENIHPEVVNLLRRQGHDVQTVVDEELGGQSDVLILRQACQQERVVLTHDSDFGTLAIVQEEPLTGIIFLRPGHIKAEFTIETLQALAVQALDVQTPFIVVAERSGSSVKFRVRQL